MGEFIYFTKNATFLNQRGGFMRYFFKVFALLLIVFNFSPSFAVELTCPASTFQNHQALVDSIPEG